MPSPADDLLGQVVFHIQDVYIDPHGEVIVVGEVGETGLRVGDWVVAHFAGERHVTYRIDTIRSEKTAKLTAKYQEAVGLKLTGFLLHELRAGTTLHQSIP